MRACDLHAQAPDGTQPQAALRRALTLAGVTATTAQVEALASAGLGPTPLRCLAFTSRHGRGASPGHAGAASPPGSPAAAAAGTEAAGDAEGGKRLTPAPSYVPDFSHRPVGLEAWLAGQG